MDLSRVRPVFEEAGPFVTVHAEVGRANENPQGHIEARWTSIRHRLEALGTAGDLIEAIGARVTEVHHLEGEVRRTLVANGGGILLDDLQAGHSHYPEVVEQDVLPDLMAWLANEDAAVPFLLVVVDRSGADIDVHRALSRPSVQQESVTQEAFFITKVHAGGWSDRHYDLDVEESWKQHAEDVATQVHSLARHHRPRAVFVAGAVRARSMVLTALESEGVGHLGDVVAVESGGRGEGSSQEALWDEVSQHLRTISARAEGEVSAALDEARGRGEGAATGLDEVLEALAKAQVDTLVLDPAGLEDKVVAPARHPGLPLPKLAASADELPAARALLAAAALSGAGATLMPAEMAHGGGVSALLRWSDDAPAEPTDTV